MDEADLEGGAARPQGRPPRGTREIGRERLIESTRDAMRMRPKIDIQRREIAEHAGVTPALVSYYFPDKAALLELAAQPVIEAYAADVRLILRAPIPLKERLTRLISLFLAFNSEQGFILDHYLEVSFAKKRESNFKMLAAVKQELGGFFGELIASGILQGDDPLFLYAALWGMCRYVGRGGEADVLQRDGQLEDAPNELTRKVLALLSA